MSPVLLLLAWRGVSALLDADGITARRKGILAGGLGSAAVALNPLAVVAVVMLTNRDFERGVLDAYAGVGAWLRTETPPGARVAIASDVGVIGFTAERTIIDLAGLNSREVHPYLPDRVPYLLVSRPECLVVTGEVTRRGFERSGPLVGMATSVYSTPLDPGSRRTLDRLLGGPADRPRYATVYRLDWSAGDRGPDSGEDSI